MTARRCLSGTGHGADLAQLRPELVDQRTRQMSSAQRGAEGIVLFQLEGAERQVRKVRKWGERPERLGTRVLGPAARTARVDQRPPGMDEVRTGRLDPRENGAAHVPQTYDDQPDHDRPFPMHASSSRASASFRPEGLTSLQRTCHCQTGAGKVRKRALFWMNEGRRCRKALKRSRSHGE